MSARQSRPRSDVPTRLVEIAARMLAEQGSQAVTARRVTAAAGLSTMAVYTHFGSMDGLLAAVWREGFARFGEELDRPARTKDAVADWMAQGWGYRHFARREPHLYEVMFGHGLDGLRAGDQQGIDAALRTFLALLSRLERCVEQGRFDLDDVTIAGEVVWAGSHGHVEISRGGYFEVAGRDEAASFEEMMVRVAIGFGDDPERARASAKAARRRATRAGLV